MMKKIVIANGDGVRSAEAYEYPLKNEPKGDAVKVMVNDVECRGRTTSGRGKSAIPNYYLYFVEGDKLFYVKSSAAEVLEFRAGKLTLVDEGAVVEAAKALETVAETATEPAKPRRVRVAK
jgi:hypothetical protein